MSIESYYLNSTDMRGNDWNLLMNSLTMYDVNHMNIDTMVNIHKGVRVPLFS